VDAPDQARRVINFKRLALTDLKIDLPRLAPKKVVVAKFAEGGA
jgi:large subunit ribosomal protein L14e